jgi:hypothetical protein
MQFLVQFSPALKRRAFALSIDDFSFDWFPDHILSLRLLEPN